MRHVLVVDSCSNDDTIAIASQFPNVVVLSRKFSTLADQHNFATKALSEFKWILRLDCDWEVSECLRDELLTLLRGAPEACAFQASFNFLIHGAAVPIALYPPKVVFFQRELCYFDQDGHAEVLICNGRLGFLRNRISHHDLKSVDRFLLSQVRYSSDELGKVLSRSAGGKSLLIRLKYYLRGFSGAGALIAFVWLGLIRFGIFRGRESRHYIVQRLIAELVLSLRVLDSRLRSR